MNRIQLASVLVIAAIAILTGWVYLSSTKEQIEVTPAPLGQEELVEETAELPGLTPGMYVLYTKEVVADRGEDVEQNSDDVREETYWVYPVAGGTPRQLTDEQAQELLPSKEQVWTGGTTTVTADFVFKEGERGPTVTMNVVAAGDSTSITFDDAEMGIEFGYPWPAAVASDGSAVYLRQVFEGEGWFSGFWKYDVVTGEITRCAYCDTFALKMPFVNPATKQMIATSFPQPESLSDWIMGPSALHLIDLQTMNGMEISSSADLGFVLPTLSPEGTYYSYNWGNEQPPQLWVVPVVGGEFKNSNRVIQGSLLTWVDDHTLLVDRSGELVLYQMTTRAVTAIDRTIGFYQDSDYQRIAFVDIVTVE